MSDIKEQIKTLMVSITEKRTDIADILEQILAGTWDGDTSYIEHRYIICPIPEGATEVTYDTCTTRFAFYQEGKGYLESSEWGVNEEYTDN